MKEIHSNRCGGSGGCTGTCKTGYQTFTNRHGATICIPKHTFEDFVDSVPNDRTFVDRMTITATF